MLRYNNNHWTFLNNSHALSCLILLAVVTRAHLGRLEGDIPHPIQTEHGHVHVLRLHDVTALADTGHGLCGTHCRCPA